jgi:hypothetical protein
MKDRRTYLGVKLAAGDDAAWDRVMAAAKKCSGCTAKMAGELGVSVRIVKLWMSTHKRMRDGVNAVRPPRLLAASRSYHRSRAKKSSTMQEVEATADVA